MNRKLKYTFFYVILILASLKTAGQPWRQWIDSLYKMNGHWDIQYKEDSLRSLSFFLGAGVYRSDTLKGEYVVYDNRGDIILEARTLDNKFDGNVYVYSSKKKLFRIYQFYKGQLLSYINLFKERVFENIEFDSTCRVKIDLRFRRNGKKYALEKYINGKIIEYDFFYRNGNLQLSFRYDEQGKTIGNNSYNRKGWLKNTSD